MTDVVLRQSTGPITPSARAVLRLGFVGVGWIGRNRLASLAESGLVEIGAVTDPDGACIQACREIAPRAQVVGSLDELLSRDLDGIVIATPDAGGRNG